MIVNVQIIFLWLGGGVDACCPSAAELAFEKPRLALGATRVPSRASEPQTAVEPLVSAVVLAHELGTA